MKKTKKSFKKTMALTLAATMATSTVAFANPISSYENTHRTLWESFSLQGNLPVRMTIPHAVTTADIDLVTTFSIRVMDASQSGTATLTTLTSSEVQVGNAFTGSFTITFDGDYPAIDATFVNDYGGTWVTIDDDSDNDWITTASYDSENKTTITFTITGTPAYATKADITIEIPADELFTGPATDVYYPTIIDDGYLIISGATNDTVGTITVKNAFTDIVEIVLDLANADDDGNIELDSQEIILTLEQAEFVFGSDTLNMIMFILGTEAAIVDATDWFKIHDGEEYVSLGDLFYEDSFIANISRVPDEDNGYRNDAIKITLSGYVIAQELEGAMTPR